MLITIRAIRNKAYCRPNSPVPFFPLPPFFPHPPFVPPPPCLPHPDLLSLLHSTHSLRTLFNPFLPHSNKLCFLPFSFFYHHTPCVPQPLNDCRSRRGLNDSFAEFDSTEDEEKILRVPKEYVLRVLNSTGALIREECEIECSRGIFTASPGKSLWRKYIYRWKTISRWDDWCILTPSHGHLKYRN